MKLKIVFSSLILIVACFWACNSETTTEKNKDTATTVKKRVIADVEPEACRVPDPKNPGEYLPYRITDSCANAYLDDYQAYVTKALDTLEIGGGNPAYNSTRLVYGAKVNLGEIRDILNDSKHKDADDLFVMMGVVNTDSTEMIFVLQSAATGATEYFDFTRPCPPGCP